MVSGHGRGLSAAEVAERQRRGESNRVPTYTGREYAAIVARNLLTLFNALVVPAAAALFALGEPQAGLAVSGMAVVNSALGLIQEIRAKRHLEQLALLTEQKARVLREGQVLEVPSHEVVRGDWLVLRAGDMVVADGPVLEAHFLEVDEALLTGESEPVSRRPGEELLSGSICVAGEGIYRAERVGLEAFAQRTAAEARRYHYLATPMIRAINRIIQILTATAISLCLLYLCFYFLGMLSVDRLVLMVAATITAMVPQGLVLTATIAFTLGAVVLSQRGAVVQRLNAVEAMAAIEVLCTDKTGTLTTNRLRLARLVPLAADLTEEAIRQRLALFVAATVDQRQRIIQALRAAVGEAPAEVLDQLPFKSEKRFSAVHLRAEGQERWLLLGAPEALLPGLPEAAAPAATDTAAALRAAGWQVLLFAEVPAAAGSLPPLHELPSTPAHWSIRLLPLALLALEEELRPQAAETLRQLAAQGIALKILSGDHPETVRNLLRPLGLALDQGHICTGADLEQAKNKEELIYSCQVFGRLLPQQKLEIITCLQQRGLHVAMIGDGVNDVLALKRADLGIALGEGSQAARAVAALVLEHQPFALLPETLEEGRTLVRNLRRSAKVFLIKNVYSLLFFVAYASGLGHLPFPYLPQQVTLLDWLVIGLPALVLAVIRERSPAQVRTPFLREVGGFALRTGGLFGLAGLVLLFLGGHLWHYEPQKQTTQLLSLLILLSLTALYRILYTGPERPLASDRWLFLLALSAVPFYLLVMYWPWTAAFFRLTPLDIRAWLEVLAVTAGTALLTWATDRPARQLKETAPPLTADIRVRAGPAAECGPTGEEPDRQSSSQPPRGSR
jgi:cation-transporting ATPase E